MNKRFKNVMRFYDNVIMESNKWRKEFIRLIEERKFDELNNFIQSTTQKLYIEQYRIGHYIDEFTCKTKTEKEKQELLEKLTQDNKYIKSSKINEGTLVIDTIDGKILVFPLSKLYPELKKDKPDIETMGRKRLCHLKTPGISLRLDVPNDIVTGYKYGLSDKEKYLHTWIELEMKNKQIVIDYTMNAVINKSGFYLLGNPEPISRISQQTLKQDGKKLTQFGDMQPIELVEYLIYRDEIMRDLDRNKKIFDEEEK